MSKFLLVDDDQTFQFLGTRTLNSIGYTNDLIHSALDGQQALDLFNNYFTGTRSLPDVILLDLNMPVMDGFTFMEAFKRLNIPNKEKVKIIIVTSSANVSDRERAMSLGAAHYLVKPLQAETLVEALQLSGIDKSIIDLDHDLTKKLKSVA